jgi:hypothetical protein
MKKPETPDEFMRRYPRITAHIISESLGYAHPRRAARIALDGLHNMENYCEWIHSCYQGNSREALQRSIRNRHFHAGYMSDYGLAKRLVDCCLETGDEPAFASWF